MVNRLFQMVYLLLEKPYMTANELSAKLEVSKRTIYRDLDQLSAAGIPVYTNRGKNGGISLLSDYVLDRTVLTHDERNKILESLQALGEISFEEEQAMYDKLQSFLGNETQDWLEVSFSTWGDNGKAAEWFRQIKRAILQHKFIEIEYAGANQNVTVRCIRPLKLCFKDQAWYVYGFCQLREDYRFFKLSRISKLCVLEKQFEREYVGKVLTNSYAEDIQGREPVTVVVEIKKEMAFRVYDELTNVITNDNGDLICTLEIREMEWFLAYVISYGEYAKVLEPESVRELVKQKVKEIAMRYEQEG